MRKTVKINSIKPNQDNPRTITKDKFDKLVQSIQKFPEMLKLRPIVVDKYMMVLGGNMRLNACKEAGLKEIPIVIADNLTEEQKREFIIKDNLGYGEWNWDVIANEWDTEELKDWGLDIPVNFEAIEIEENIAHSDEDAIPNIDNIENICKLGDIWLLGKHRLMCGDSTKIGNVNLLMNGKKADMVFTDPPYNLEPNGGGYFNNSSFKNTMNSIKHLCDFNPDDFLNILPSYFNKNMNAYIFCNKDLVPNYLNWAVKSKFSFNILFWKKGMAVPLGHTHKPDVEYLLHFRKNAIWNNNLLDVNYSKCLDYARVNYQDKITENGNHPTPKPIELIENEIKISSNKDSIVVDMFGGSGSTLIACEKTNRICFTMEIDPKYCDIIIKRWEDYTQKKAILQKIN